MKDSDPKVLQPHQLVDEPMTEQEHEDTLLLGTDDLRRTANSLFKSQMSKELDRIPITEEGEALRNELMQQPNSSFANTDSFKRLLLSPLAQDIMSIIWRESDHVSARSVQGAGLGRQFHGTSKHLTRNSLKNSICDDSDEIRASGGDALKRSIDRICCALEVYGLIERTTIRGNLKPITATKRLYNLMAASTRPVTRLYAQQLSDNDNGAHNG